MPYRTAAVATTVAALLLTLALGAAAAGAAGKPRKRDVLVVSNNWAGTADLVDPHTFKRLKRLDVVPDKAARIAQIGADPTHKLYYDLIRQLIGEGHDQYVDDGFVSRDGRVVFFSRPSFADVVAIDVRTNEIRWRTHVDGYRADHMALSPDGRRLLVSASTARVVDVLDTASGAIVGTFASGDSPHENTYSRDGGTIFHASIGTVYTDTDDPALDATKGERVFEVVDAATLQVTRRIDMRAKLAEFGRPDMSAAVRPMAIAPDERFVYFQLSFFHGFAEYDLAQDKVTRVIDLPLTPVSEGMPRQEYVLDSAHHGLAMNPKGTKLCAAGTMSEYAAIVKRGPLALQRIVPVGKTPYWSASSEDGRYCFVSVAGNDRVSVISFRTAKEVARIKVGDHPQRMRTGRVRRSALR
ncbi:MAG TPA: YncE family protein [Solirubrobacteraceae bacterium]|jgi:DNA-binding beta-propeller fold protein YncE|nr:YncE family protein [Solirubrobacteraceae bacterium]